MQIVFKALFLNESRPKKDCDGRPRPASTLDYSTIGDKLAREFFCEYIHHVSPPCAIMGIAAATGRRTIGVINGRGRPQTFATAKHAVLPNKVRRLKTNYPRSSAASGSATDASASATWLPGTRPGMTLKLFRHPEVRASASLEGCGRDARTVRLRAPRFGGLVPTVACQQA